MNTPIIKISDDQNEITHESGVVTVFEETKINRCNGCVYQNPKVCKSIAPCFRFERIDNKTGIFKLKNNADTI